MASPSPAKFHPARHKVVSRRNLGPVRLAIRYRRSSIPTIRVSLILYFVIPYFAGNGGKRMALGEKVAIPGGGPEARG
ncbi:MAG: hypothetical protein A2139_00870 [Desulfobacca sp. RBG_16_60_12]|nr:MAG: hypothetical protein A2139_00870 [Desulfobacca sp. RBG_16_60_12]